MTCHLAASFAPNQINLPTVLDLIDRCSGNKEALEETLKDTYFRQNSTDERNKRKLAMNLRLSLKAYGIIDDAIHFTDLVLFCMNIGATTRCYTLNWPNIFC